MAKKKNGGSYVRTYCICRILTTPNSTIILLITSVRVGCNVSREQSIHVESNSVSSEFIKNRQTSSLLGKQLADSADKSNDDMDYHIEKTNGQEDTQRVLEFLKKFFFRDDPLYQCIQSGDDSVVSDWIDCYPSFEEDLFMILMAVTANGTIVGVLLSEIKTNPLSNEEPEYIQTCKNAKIKKILLLLHNIDKSLYMSGQFQNSRVLDIIVMATDTNWRGKGVGKTLLKKMIEIAKEHGFHYIWTDCTSLFSAKLFAQFGFDEINKLNYNDYVDEDGKPIFSPVSPHTAVVTYLMKLCG